MLLATYNGRRWITEQLDSILSQEPVEVQVIALDDGSTDGTAKWLASRAAQDPRIKLLRSEGPSGSSGANFYRLLMRAPIEGLDYLAFADQDDIWLPGKLARHVDLLAGRNVDGVSSSVTSFTEDGRRTLVKKDYPQRHFDYLFESPGPGSTYLMTPRLVLLVRDVLTAVEPNAHEMEYHDSLVYAVARAKGWAWHIDGTPSVDYRQHSNNVLGSNVGWRPALARLSMITNHWHRGYAELLCRISISVASGPAQKDLESLHHLLVDRRIRSRLALATRSDQLRRRPRDRFIICVLIAIGIW